MTRAISAHAPLWISVNCYIGLHPNRFNVPCQTTKFSVMRNSCCPSFFRHRYILIRFSKTSFQRILTKLIVLACHLLVILTISKYSVQQNELTSVFWMSWSAVTVVLYIWVGVRNPGFIGQPPPFLTDSSSFFVLPIFFYPNRHRRNEFPFGTLNPTDGQPENDQSFVPPKIQKSRIMNSHSNSNPNSPTSLSLKLSSSFNSNSKAKSVSTDSNSNSDGSSRCHRTGFKNEVEVNIEMGKWNGDSEFDDFGLKTIKPNVLKEQEEINEIEDGEIENDDESRELLDDGDKKGYRVSRERSKLEVNDAELNNDSDGGRGRGQREVGIDFFGDIPKLPCRICDVVLPLRARHCVKCQRCVMKFDHHCFLIANCVGQNNHVLFYTYLFFESVLTWKCMILNLSLLFNLPSLHFTTDILLFISLLIVVSFTGICTGLLIFHSYLILTNLTTWEYLRGPRSIHGNRVPYLALDQYGIDLQREDVFSHGAFMNCLVFWARSVAVVPSARRWLEVKENYDGRRIPSGRAGKQGLVSRIWKMCF